MNRTACIRLEPLDFTSTYVYIIFDLRYDTLSNQAFSTEELYLFNLDVLGRRKAHHDHYLCL
jgi:hypothetical protein